MTGRPGGWLPRIAPSLFAALVFLVFAALWRFDFSLYLAVMGRYIWTAPTPIPFDDFNAVLQAGACWAQGADVYLPNGCMHGGSFNYSPALLRIGLLFDGQGTGLAAGTLLSLIFIASCAWLPPARTGRELVLRCAVICSSAAAHGMECGNIDLAMFSLAAAGVALQSAGFAGRLAGYAIFLLGGALKFYPAVLLVFLLRESRWRLAGIGLILAAGAAMVLWRDGGELRTILDSLPLGLPFRGSFGAINLPFGLVLLAFMPKPSVLPDGATFHLALHHPGLPVLVIVGSKILTIAGLIAGLRLVPDYAAGLAALDARRQSFLVAGATLIAFCFYVAPNYEYRGVFLLFTLPGLYTMAAAPGRRAGPWLWLMLALIPLLLWERALWQIFEWMGSLLPGRRLADCLGIVLWLLRECGWWFIAVNLTAISFAYLRAAMQNLRSGSGVLLRDETGWSLSQRE